MFFFTDSIIEGADVETFEKRDIGGSWCVFDRNRIYSGDSVRWQNYMKTEYKKKINIWHEENRPARF